MKKVIFSFIVFSLVGLWFSCSKDQEPYMHENQTNTSTKSDNRSRVPSTSNDTEIAIVLGRRRNNPYTVSNMLLAINKIYKTNYSTLPATHKYVKFLPTTQEHLAILEDWETEKLTPLFSYPLEYEIDIPGDYYYDPAVTDSMYTYKYASVEVGITLPNVPFQVIDDIFIPPYNSYVTEQAFYQVGEPYDGDTSPHPDGPGDGDDPNDNCNPGCANYPCCKVGWVDCDGTPCSNDPVGPIPCEPGDPDWPACLEVFPPTDPSDPNNPGGQGPSYCECTEYSQGNPQGSPWIVWIGDDEDCSNYEYFSNDYWIECNTYTAPPPPPPVVNECGCPIPSNPRFPAGCIEVDADNSFIDPVKLVMVVLKDTWFTTDIVYTNSSGCWQHNEEYSNNVWVTVKFKNNNCKIRAMRRNRYLEAVGVADDYVDRFGAPPYNHIYVHYENSSDNESRTRRYWACGHTINGDGEYRTNAATDGISIPRTSLNYFLSASDNSTGGAPMLQWQWFDSWPFLFVALALPNLPMVTSPLYPDITNNYNFSDGSMSYKGTQFHELGHASHYSLVGESYWLPYRNHIVVNTIAGNGVYGSFGNFASGSDPERVALGEAIGNYVGFIYGQTGSGGENNEWGFNFIPAGLMYDLFDPDVDRVTDPNNTSIFRDDIITGFTPAMFFGALVPNVNSIRGFRDRLSTLSLGATSNTLSEYNAFVDVYDVFN